jgi:hypothetical protein
VPVIRSYGDARKGRLAEGEAALRPEGPSPVTRGLQSRVAVIQPIPHDLQHALYTGICVTENAAERKYTAMHLSTHRENFKSHRTAPVPDRT